MWRGIVLGKLSVSIVVSAIVCYVCIRQGQQADDWFASARWYGLSLFFGLLGFAMIASLYLLHYRKK